MARFPFGQKAEDFAANVGPTGSIMATANTFFIFFDSRIGGSEITDLTTDLAGTLPITEGSYKTDAFGNFATKFYGPDTVKELWAQAVASSAPRTLIQCWQSALPVSSFSPSGGTAWVASTAYAVGAVFIRADGQYRQVKTAYTSGGTYVSGTDDTNSTALGPVPSTFSQSLTDSLYPPISSTLSNMQFWDGRVLKVGYDMNPNGFKMPFTGLLNQIQLELDTPTVGADDVLQITMLNTGSGGNVETQVAIGRIVNGQVSVITPLVRTDATCGTNSTTSTITDSHITVDDFGRAVSGTGIPAGSYVGTVTAGVSFVLSSSPTVSTPRNASATGTVTLTIGVQYAVTKKDKMFIRGLGVGSTYPGKALMVSLAFGSETFASCTTPGNPGTPSVTASTASSVTFGWTAGANSSQTVIFRDGSPYDYVGGATSYTDSGLASNESHTYGVAARRGTALSAIITAGSAFGPSTTLSLLPAADGAPSASYIRRKGSAVTALALISSNRFRLLSGPTGSDSVNDRQQLWDAGDVTKAFEIQCLFNFQDNASYLQLYGTCSDFDPSTGGTGSTATYLRVQLAYFQAKLGYNTGGGFTQLGSSTTLSLTAGADYGFRFVGSTVDPTAGTQVLTLYQGSAAAFNASPASLPQVAQYTVTSAIRAAIPAGKMMVQQLGAQVGSTAKTEYSDFGILNFQAGTS